MAYKGGYQAGNALEKVNYTHDALIDMIISNPECYQYEFAAKFGYTPAWVSQVMSSDAFKARLEARREEIVNPALVASVKERLEGVAQYSMQRLMQRLEVDSLSGKELIEAVNVSTKALGYGARAQNTNINLQQNSFVVALPEKAATAAEWAAEHAGGRGQEVEVVAVQHQNAPTLPPEERVVVTVPAIGTGEPVEV